MQQVQVMDDAEERLVGDHLAAERDHERLAAERVDGVRPLRSTDERAWSRNARSVRHGARASGGRFGERWPGRGRRIICPSRPRRIIEHVVAASRPPQPEQRAAVTLPHVSALILAGAGSGKTRVLTTRIAWLLATAQASPLSILAVTFTNKAAKEMLTRLSAMTPVNIRGMWIGTFHGLCNRMLRAHYRDARLPQLFQIMDTQDQLALIAGLYRRTISRQPLSAAAAPAVHRRCEGKGQRPNQVEAGDDFRADWSVLRALRAMSSARAWSISRALLRSYELLRTRRCASTTGVASRTC
jgi:hypothetical protein